MRCAGAAGPLAAALLGCLVAAVAGETVRLTDLPLPKPWTAHVLQMVYPVGGTVKLHDMSVAAGDNKTTVHLGLIPWAHVHDVMDSHFCEPDGNLKLSSHPSAKDVVRFNANPGGVVSGTGEVSRAPYGLFVANCGSEEGKVGAVMTWGGGASGHESYVLPICSLSALAMAGLLLWWQFTLYDQAEHCQPIHHSLTILALVAFGESVCHVVHYAMLHSVGQDSVLQSAGEDDLFKLFGAAFCATKVCLCFITVLEAANFGAGQRPSMKHHMAVTVFSVGISPRLCLGLVRHTELTPLNLTLLYTAIADLSGMLALAVSGKVLSESMKRATDSDQQELLGNLRQTCVVILFLVGATALVSVLDVFDRPEVSADSWGYHAFAVTAPIQVAFLMGLLHMLRVWRPRPGCVLTQIQNGEPDAEMEGLAAWKSDEEEGASPAADTIGAGVE